MLQSCRIKKSNENLFDEEFVNEINLKIIGDSIIITKNFLLYYTRNKSSLIYKEDVRELITSNKNFKITIILKNNNKRKIKYNDETQQKYIENWFKHYIP